MPISTEQLAKAGVVGAGGAGFPTHVKLSAKADTVVINAAECEPLLHKDQELILHYGDRLVEGLRRAMEAVGAKRGIVGIKRKYDKVIAHLQKLLLPGMEIGPLDDVYPAGDEFILVYQTLGRVIAPGAIPITVGVVVLNVETACNVAVADRTPVIEKYVSIAGAVQNPCTVCVPIGAPLSVCLEAAGGANIDDPAYVVGGAMMGFLTADLSMPVSKTTGGLIVLPKDHFIVQRKSWDWEKAARVGRAACDQCSKCTELCPRYLLGHPIEPAKTMRSLGFNLSMEANTAGSQFCSECNLCSYCSCPEGLDPRRVNAQNKQRIFKEGKRWTNPPFDPERAERLMSFRKTPTARLMQRICLTQFVNKGPLLEARPNVSSVEILLKQNVGAAAVPVVKIGDHVRAGDPVAVRPVVDGKTALGVDHHASIDGIITAISDRGIRIDRQ
ncbi:MAG: SLBB domain-containing protein [Planctomycetia bacterium]|nr:SLBB domain-containing protein [Planctomycetia bacterium]